MLNVKDTILVNCFDRKNFLSRLSLFLFIHYLNFFFFSSVNERRSRGS